MLKFSTILIVFVLVSTEMLATHLVGGEFEMQHVSGTNYVIRQIQYFDVVNGDAGAEDPNVTVAIFRKRDNVVVETFLLLKTAKSRVSYTNPVCTNASLITNKIVYEREVTLNASSYSDPAGYYIVWERCCRNYIISNIDNPDQTGQTFYLEFPPIVKNGEPFINSSPRLFPPLSDYGCVGRFYYADFRGSDIDGDSLVYTLRTPLNSSEAGPDPNPLPDPSPAPHPLVNWSSGFNEQNQIPGSPSLTINKAGFLTLVPSAEGLFVFSVLCEEFRDGEKIGEVVRDFQLLVLDCPDPGVPPEIEVKAPGSGSFSTKIDTLNFVIGEERCLDFQVKDADGYQRIKVKAIPVNFDEDVSSILSATSGYTFGESLPFSFDVCVPECPYIFGEPYIIDIVAMDNSCPQPQMDTMRLVINVEPPPNSPPQFVGHKNSELYLKATVGDSLEIDIQGVDADGDSIILDFSELLALDSVLDLSFEIIRSESGSFSAKLDWKMGCHDVFTQDTPVYNFNLYIDDDDYCGQPSYDTLKVTLEVLQPTNNAPLVYYNGETSDRVVHINVEDALDDVLKAVDSDGDLIDLVAVCSGFTLSDYDMDFQNESGLGSAQSRLTWHLLCSTLNPFQTDTLIVHYIADDHDKCLHKNSDSLTITYVIAPPVNTAPSLYFNGSEINDYDTVRINPMNKLEYELLATDAENDFISLKILSTNASMLMDEIMFDPVEGNSEVKAAFNWAVQCNALGENLSAVDYYFRFVVSDDKCHVPMSDTVTLNVHVSDLPVKYDIFIPNVFTPDNFDKINSHFFVPDIPENNCYSQFQYIKIVNRWGETVYKSEDREFRWDAKDQPVGVYYYFIRYSSNTYKGIVSIVK